MRLLPRPVLRVSVRSATPGGRWVVFTDLDGTLLDHDTYAHEPAAPALAALQKQDAIIVLASSKTGAELEELSRRLDLRFPLISENGGAILLPRARCGFRSLPLGIERSVLVRALDEIAGETSLPLTGFSALQVEEVARITGLSIQQALSATRREFDEPFLAPASASIAALNSAAARRGLRISRGGRFLHLTGQSDKGRAATLLFSHLGRRLSGLRSMALGDAANDLPMLRSVMRPVVIPQRSGQPAQELRTGVPEAELAPFPGPRGWNAAVLAVLQDRRLPHVGDSPIAEGEEGDRAVDVEIAGEEENP